MSELNERPDGAAPDAPTPAEPPAAPGEAPVETPVGAPAEDEAAPAAEAAPGGNAEGAEEPAREGKPDRGERKRQRKAEADLAGALKREAALETELAEEREKYLRMLAEYENFRRRTQKEKEAIYGDACADTVRELLPVVDTLERAVAGLSEEEAATPLGKGLSLTLKSAVDALEKLGVREVEIGSFNPDIHHAVMHVEDETLGEGTVAEVFLKGYRRGDRVIRCAMVKVAN